MMACKSCGGDVVWKRDGKRWQCFNLDGSVHWDMCSQRRFERIKATGTPFEDVRDESAVEGYRYQHETKGEREQLTRIAARKVRASTTLSARIAACRQCVPAWELCPNKCPAEIRS